ncbi:MAG: hypothetical protein PHP01_01950 [Phycisphaerae bacterium]|nr:hypothetical protein [Phycisphaerae bacterium]
MADWEIHKPLGTCVGTERVIDPGEEYIATLIETEQGLVRRDYCLDYWNQNKPVVYCYWKTAMPSSEQKKKLFIDDDMLIAFFERLENETDDEKVNFRFVLTLILMRKRILKYDFSEKVDGKEVWTLKIAGRGEIAKVINPYLTEDKIEQLSSQLGQILQVELNRQ